MGPAEGKLDAAALGQRAVAAIAIDLQHAPEAGQMGHRSLGLAVGCVDVDHAGRIGAAPGPVVAGIGPELSRLGPAAAGIEHRCAGLVGEQLRRRLQLRQQPLMDRAQVPGGVAHPIGERRAVEGEPLAGVDLGLAIKRQMIGILGDQDLGDARLGRQPALDQPRGRRRLHHHLGTGAAGVFGPAHDQDAQLRWHDVEALGDILADHMQRARAARTGLVFDVDDRLHPRQMRRQVPAVRPALVSLRLSAGRGGRVRFGVGRDLLDLFQPKQQLILGQRLGPAAEAMALQLLDDLAQPIVLGPLGEEHRLERIRIVGKRLRRDRHGRD